MDGDDRHREVADRIERRLRLFGHDLRLRDGAHGGKIAEVAAGREALVTGAGHGCDAQGLIRGMALEGLLQFGEDGAAQRIPLGRPIDGDREAPVGGLDDQLRLGHGETASAKDARVSARLSPYSASIVSMRWIGPAMAIP